MAEHGSGCGCPGRLLLPPNSHFFLFESRHQGHQIVVKSEGRRPPTHRIAFNSLYLFSLGLLSMKQMGRHCLIHAWSDCQLPTYRRELPQFLPSFPVYALKHPGGVASMTRDRGYPDWLVLSARLLAQPSCGQVTIVQNRCLIVFPCGYVKILQPVAICTVIFVTISKSVGACF